MSVQIFRVENTQGSGMYVGDKIDIHSRGLSFESDSAHPHPTHDSSISTWYNSYHSRGLHFFGFGSLEQLRMWLHNQEIKDKLHEQGFLVNVYVPRFTNNSLIDDFIIGDTQAIFKKHLFTVVSTLSISTLT